jgi:hypothetical protein
MCLDNKKLLSLETVMATNPWMYSRTQKKQHGKKKKKNHFHIELRQQTILMYVVEHDKIYSEALGR